MRSPVPVFVIDGHDIELYSDAASAAVEIEGYDALDLTILGADGTVFEAVVEGPEWGLVTLRDNGRNGLRDLVTLLRGEAAARSVGFPADLPDESTAIWQAVIDAQLAQQTPPRQWGNPTAERRDRAVRSGHRSRGYLRAPRQISAFGNGFLRQRVVGGGGNDVHQGVASARIDGGPASRMFAF